MDANYIKRALCFHGQPMQKIWEDERGVDDLQKLGVPHNADYSVYQERQKYFTFQDRAKRLKMHQFFARKAEDLYDCNLDANRKPLSLEQQLKAQKHLSILPPYEVFLDKQQDRVERWRCLLQGIKAGDIIYGVVMKFMSKGVVVKPLCTKEPVIRYLGDMPTKAYLQYSNGPAALLSELTAQSERPFNVNDFVCCEVLEVSVDADRIMLGMEGNLSNRDDVKFGIVESKDLPAYYRISNENDSIKFEDCLSKSLEFNNPNYDDLFAMNDLDINDNFTFIKSLKKGFPPNQYAKELRKAQASQWAMNSVTEGIEHFKQGNDHEAFQLLNKALQIDPQNVEGLVARGALYANKRSFKRAVDDFHRALQINSSHPNARKYMAETLLALGRSYEEDGCIPGAKKAYTDCLKLIPMHQPALQLLQQLETPAAPMMMPSMVVPPSANMLSSGMPFVPNAPIMPSMPPMPSSNLHQKQHPANFATYTNVANRNGTADDARNAAVSREKSLSPLSKRMFLHAESLKREREGTAQLLGTTARFDQPFYMLENNAAAPVLMPHDFKLDDDDTKSRVQKLLSAADQYKKKKSKKNKSKDDKRDEKLLPHSQSDFSAAMHYDNNYEDLHESKCLQFLEQCNSSTKKHQAAAAAYKSSSSRRSPFDAKSKLSLQIKRPVQLDKMGMIRIASPIKEQQRKSTTPDRSSRHSGSSRRRSRSRSGYHRRHHKRSRSPSHTRSPLNRHRRRHSSRSRTRSRSRSPYHRRSYRRTPSSFVSRETPPRCYQQSYTHLSSRQRHRSRSRSDAHSATHGKITNNSGYTVPTLKLQTDRWLHDKYLEDENNALSKRKPIDDGPTIEEIDELINKAQRERKEEIIKRDKNILKKTKTGN